MRFQAYEKAAAVEREVKQRRRVYPRLIEQNRLSAQKAAQEIAIMEEIAQEYRAASEKERLL